MKRIGTFTIIIMMLAVVLAYAMGNVESPKKCRQCGMDRTVFATSRMVIEYSDETAVGVCSIHCASVELDSGKGKKVHRLMVADYSTKELIDAGSASWVVGGKKKGVMTAVAKWAFAKREDAIKFTELHGGIVTSYDQAMNSATIEVRDQAAEEMAVGKEILR
jgi:nitrous oxide reductase accessory protein NosL